MIHTGDALTVLRTMDDESAQCCVTSPPYWGLRDYGVDGQMGLESTPAEYVARMVEVMREVRRVLRKDGTLWLNMGDTYAAKGGYGTVSTGLKAKDLCGIPWRLALALQEDGWWLRSEIIWHKPNPMPSSVKDRPTVAHETIFLLSRSARYFYDYEAVREPSANNGAACNAYLPGANGIQPGNSPQSRARQKVPGGWDVAPGAPGTIHRAGRTTAAYTNRREGPPRPSEQGHNGMPPQAGLSRLSSHGKKADGRRFDSRALRSVWTIPTHPYPQAHFATFPPRLAETCIKAGCPVGGVVLDPFSGAGTTGLVAAKLGRRYVGIELNPAYVAMARDRIANEAGLLEVGV